jgi:transposase
VPLSQVSRCMSCQHGISLDQLLPHLAGIVVQDAELAEDRLVIWARVRAEDGMCPKCEQSSARVNSGYQRRLADMPVGGRGVVIRLNVRRFFCDQAACPKKTFAEQVPGLTVCRGRRTPPLAGALTGIALALAGRAGARLAALLDHAAGKNSLLRLVMALPDPGPGVVRVLAVDDFAFRRGRDYGTILINVETGAVVDLLRDREASTLEDWLKAHPGTEVICRDRATAYADGAGEGAPDAIQVADRWHIYHNLAGYVGKAVARHRSCLKDPGPDLSGPGTDAEPQPDLAQLAAEAAARRADDSVLARRTRDRYDQVQALRAQGLGVKPIMRQTGLAKETVRRFYRAATLDELLATTRDGRPSLLDEHKPYLHQRWNQGCTNVRQLHAELRERGYRGGYGTIRDYVQPFRELGAAPPAEPAPPKTREVTSWILTDPDHLDDEKKDKLARIKDRCPHLASLAAHVTGFAKIITGLNGDRLDAWITAVEADDQPELHSFTRGIRQDHDAVLNGLTLSWNSGIAEGNVNRLKMIKRQMYGRASFPLLRKRVLLMP